MKTAKPKINEKITDTDKDQSSNDDQDDNKNAESLALTDSFLEFIVILAGLTFVDSSTGETLFLTLGTLGSIRVVVALLADALTVLKFVGGYTLSTGVSSSTVSTALKGAKGAVGSG